MNGIDIYSGDGAINFSQIKADGASDIYIKATEGKTYQDSTCRSFYSQARAVGLNVGFYHYLRNNSMSDEVNNLLAATSGCSSQLKYAIDCEITLGQSAQQITNNIRQFYDIMKSRGYECVLYTYLSFLHDNIIYSQIADIPVWIADYCSSDPHVQNEVGWQFSESGWLAGASHNIDEDNFTNAIFTNGICTSTVTNPIVVSGGNATVRTIQMQLNTMLKCNLVVDGLMGGQTKQQIESFQKSMNLTADGIWGVNTAGAATQILTKPYDWTGAGHLEYATRYIQWRVGAGGDKAGSFWTGTANCLASWQRQRGLSADGKCGNETWHKLLDENC